MGALEFRNAVKAARTARGLSVREAARACGLAKSHYERLEGGVVLQPTPGTIAALARGLGCSRGLLMRAAGYV